MKHTLLLIISLPFVLVGCLNETVDNFKSIEESVASINKSIVILNATTDCSNKIMDVNSDEYKAIQALNYLVMEGLKYYKLDSKENKDKMTQHIINITYQSCSFKNILDNHAKETK